MKLSQTLRIAVPILIPLAAAAFTGLQWYETHALLVLSMKPAVDFDTEVDPDDPPVGVATG